MKKIFSTSEHNVGRQVSPPSREGENAKMKGGDIFGNMEVQGDTFLGKYGNENYFYLIVVL